MCCLFTSPWKNNLFNTTNHYHYHYIILYLYHSIAAFFYIIIFQNRPTRLHLHISFQCAKIVIDKIFCSYKNSSFFFCFYTNIFVCLLCSKVSVVKVSHGLLQFLLCIHDHRASCGNWFVDRFASQQQNFGTVFQRTH